MYAFKIDNIIIVEYWIRNVEKIKKRKYDVTNKINTKFFRKSINFFSCHIYIFFVYYCYTLLQVIQLY